jgi:hypothetical protein
MQNAKKEVTLEELLADRFIMDGRLNHGMKMEHNCMIRGQLTFDLLRSFPKRETMLFSYTINPEANTGGAHMTFAERVMDDPDEYEKTGGGTYHYDEGDCISDKEFPYRVTIDDFSMNMTSMTFRLSEQGVKKKQVRRYVMTVDIQYERVNVIEII